jgi:NAD(P)-dependent dehydrogenase (short-subunit alcohol dehydrogenase family)
MDKDQKAPTVSIQTLRNVFEPNFFGTVHTTQTLLPLIRKSDSGEILFVTTDMASNSYMAAGKANFLHHTAYNTSKAALNSYVIALAFELGDSGIKVNTVTPGFTSTKLNNFGQGGKTTKEGAETILKWALLPKDGPSGKYFGPDGNEFPW